MIGSQWSERNIPPNPSFSLVQATRRMFAYEWPSWPSSITRMAFKYSAVIVFGVLQKSELVRLEVGDVQARAEARTLGYHEGAVAHLEWHINKGIVKVEIHSAGFKAIEVWHAHHHLSPGEHIDRAARVVR